MPYTIRKANCKQSSGRSGSYVLSYVDNKGKRHSNCHTSRKKAKAQIAAIEMPESRVWIPLALREIASINEELRRLKVESHLDSEEEMLKHGEKLGFLHDDESFELTREIAEEILLGLDSVEDVLVEVPPKLIRNVASYLRAEGHYDKAEEVSDYSLTISESRRRLVSEAALTLDQLQGIKPDAVFEFTKEFDRITLQVLEDKWKVLGTLSVKKTGSNRTPCLQAWEVTWSKSDLNKLGPLMYDAMMEYVSPDYIMSDRDSVSSKARNVWSHYHSSRPDVEKDQLDDEYGLITPKDKSDDCEQWAAFFDGEPDPWSEENPLEDMDPEEKREMLKASPLAQAYRSKGTPTLDALRKKGMIIER